LLQATKIEETRVVVRLPHPHTSEDQHRICDTTTLKCNIDVTARATAARTAGNHACYRQLGVILITYLI